ncbi:MAG TPA: TolC family protein, partial [Burkholderiaceae bacterium]|nr:TolC family protein [Burkholderiaceae bacterium]
MTIRVHRSQGGRHHRNGGGRPRRLWLGLMLAAVAQAAPAQGAALSLTDALRLALANNPEHLSRRLDVDRTAAGLAAARAAKRPEIEAGASTTRYGHPTLVHSIRAPGVFPPLDETIVALGLALKLPLYTGGRLEQGVVLADLGGQIALEHERLGAQELAFNVSSVYFKIQQLDALAQVYAARIESLEAQAQRAALLRQTGKTGKLDQLKIGTLLTKARHDRLQVEHRGRAPKRPSNTAPSMHGPKITSSQC